MFALSRVRSLLFPLLPAFFAPPRKFRSLHCDLLSWTFSNLNPQQFFQIPFMTIYGPGTTKGLRSRGRSFPRSQGRLTALLTPRVGTFFPLLPHTTSYVKEECPLTSERRDPLFFRSSLQGVFPPVVGERPTSESLFFRKVDRSPRRVSPNLPPTIFSHLPVGTPDASLPKIRAPFSMPLWAKAISSSPTSSTSLSGPLNGDSAG